MEQTRHAPRRMKVSPLSAPLSPEELKFFRGLRRRVENGDVLEQYLAPADVATRLGLNKRTILDLCGLPEGFPNSVKPFPNKVRIPVSDVRAFLERRRVQASAPNQEEAGNG